jgi:lysyl-tRNA synthetase class 2
MSLPTPADPASEANPLIAERREKLAALRRAGVAFPNDFKPRHHAADLHHRHGQVPNEELEPQAIAVTVAGRMMLKRVMGKACFATLQDGSGRIQLYVTQDAVGPEALAAFKHWDLGDIVGCEGTLFRTRTGELSIRATEVRLLTKSLRPLPDKFHGLADQEQKYRQRYVDLITDDASSRAARRSRRSARTWSSTASSRSRRRCCTRSPAARTRSPSSPTTTRSTRRCSCASRQSCT